MMQVGEELNTVRRHHSPVLRLAWSTRSAHCCITFVIRDDPDNVKAFANSDLDYLEQVILRILFLLLS
jgi:hypothetical protein